jgi:hypothetical protein
MINPNEAAHQVPQLPVHYQVPQVDHNALSVHPSLKVGLFAELRRAGRAGTAACSLAVQRMLAVFVEPGAMRLGGPEFR